MWNSEPPVITGHDAMMFYLYEKEGWSYVVAKGDRGHPARTTHASTLLHLKSCISLLIDVQYLFFFFFFTCVSGLMVVFEEVRHSKKNFNVTPTLNLRQ